LSYTPSHTTQMVSKYQESAEERLWQPSSYVNYSSCISPRQGHEAEKVKVTVCLKCILKQEFSGILKYAYILFGNN